MASVASQRRALAAREWRAVSGSLRSAQMSSAIRAVTNAASAISRGPPSGARAANVAIAAKAKPGVSSAYGCRGGRTERNVDRRQADRLKVHFAGDRVPRRRAASRATGRERDQGRAALPGDVPPPAVVSAAVQVVDDREH